MGSRVKVLLLWNVVLASVLTGVRGSNGLIGWSDANPKQVSAVLNDTAVIVWEATGPIFNVTVRVGSLGDLNAPGYIYVKQEWKEDFVPIGQISDQAAIQAKFKMSFNGTRLMLRIENFQKKDEALYLAELLIGQNKPLGEYISLESRVPSTISPILSTVTDSGDGDNSSTQGASWVITVVVVLAVVAVLIIVIICIACHVKSKNAKGKYVPPKVKYKTVSANPEPITKEKSNIERKLMEVSICEAAAKKTESYLFETEKDKPIYDNYEFERFGSILKDSENVENFFNTFQLNHEGILTYPQRRELQGVIGSQTHSTNNHYWVLEQNSFDPDWRYDARYCLVVFGLTADEQYVTGVFMEYDTSIHEETFETLSIPDRLNWFRCKAMLELKKKGVIEDISWVPSLEQVSQSLISQ